MKWHCYQLCRSKGTQMSKVLSAAKWSLDLLAKRIATLRVQKVFPASRIYGSLAYDEAEMIESEPLIRDQKAELFYDCWLHRLGSSRPQPSPSRFAFKGKAAFNCSNTFLSSTWKNPVINSDPASAYLVFFNYSLIVLMLSEAMPSTVYPRFVSCLWSRCANSDDKLPKYTHQCSRNFYRHKWPLIITTCLQ